KGSVHGENIVVRFQGECLREVTIGVCEVSQCGVQQRVLLQKRRIARVEQFGLLKISFALIPFTTPSRNVGLRLRYLTGVWQKLLRLVKIAQRCVVILEERVVIVPFCIHRLTKLWLQGKGSLS